MAKDTQPYVLRLYDKVYKETTGKGEHHKAAHYAALEAVYEAGKANVGRHPLRRSVANSIRNAARKLSDMVDA
jgi:hypothetical protein